MKKSLNRKLRLSKDTIRSLVPDELRQVGGGVSCGGTGCDCSGWSSPPSSTDGAGTGLDTIDMCSTRIAY